MEYQILGQRQDIAMIIADQVVIRDAQSAIDLIASVQYQTNCHKLILSKSCLADSFFVLSTGIAGEVLQKLTNYHKKVAIVGDYSKYTSKPLKDFIYESNRGNRVFFVSTVEEAVAKLDAV